MNNNGQLLLEIQRSCLSQEMKPKDIFIVTGLINKASGSTIAMLEKEGSIQLQSSLGEHNFVITSKQVEADVKALVIHFREEASLKSAQHWKEFGGSP